MTAISHYACPRDLDFETFLDKVSAAGFSAVALTRRSFEEMSVAAIGRALRRRNLRACSVNSAGYFLNADAEAYATQAAENIHLLNITAELGAYGLNVIVGGIGGKDAVDGCLRLDEARSRVVYELYRLADRARESAVTLLVEPVHPAGIHDKGCLNTMHQVSSVIGGIVNAAITVDIYHSWWDPDFQSMLEKPEAPVGLLQICDVCPNSDGTLTARGVPGSGVVDIRSILSTVRTSHPWIPIELELFPERIAAYDFDSALLATSTLLDQVLPGAGQSLSSRNSEREGDKAEFGEAP